MATTKPAASFIDSDNLGGLGTENASNGNERRDSEPARNSGSEFTSPGDIFDGGTDNPGTYGGIPRRRGRPPGSRNRTTETKAPQNIAENLERLLLSVHLMGAATLQCPELELDETEAKKLAAAIREVSKHYPVTLDPKKLALLELGTVAMMVYGTRGVAIYRRITQEKKPKPAPLRVMPQTQPKSEPQSETPKPAQQRQLTPNDIFGLDNGVDDLSQL